MKLAAINDFVFIRLDAPKEQDGDIVIPVGARPRPNQGVVVAAGPGKQSSFTGDLIPMPVKEGDIVLIPGWAGSELEDPLDPTARPLTMLTATEIIAIIAP